MPAILDDWLVNPDILDGALDDAACQDMGDAWDRENDGVSPELNIR